ncbi:unnamed protein product [Chrysoparadoxa australica]
MVVSVYENWGDLLFEAYDLGADMLLRLHARMQKIAACLVDQPEVLRQYLLAVQVGKYSRQLVRCIVDRIEGHLPAEDSRWWRRPITGEVPYMQLMSSNLERYRGPIWGQTCLLSGKAVHMSVKESSRGDLLIEVTPAESAKLRIMTFPEKIMRLELRARDVRELAHATGRPELLRHDLKAELLQHLVRHMTLKEKEEVPVCEGEQPPQAVVSAAVEAFRGWAGRSSAASFLLPLPVDVAGEAPGKCKYTLGLSIMYRTDEHSVRLLEDSWSPGDGRWFHAKVSVTDAEAAWMSIVLRPETHLQEKRRKERENCQLMAEEDKASELLCLSHATLAGQARQKTAAAGEAAAWRDLGAAIVMNKRSIDNSSLAEKRTAEACTASIRESILLAAEAQVNEMVKSLQLNKEGQLKLNEGQVELLNPSLMESKAPLLSQGKEVYNSPTDAGHASGWHLGGCRFTGQRSAPSHAPLEQEEASPPLEPGPSAVQCLQQEQGGGGSPLVPSKGLALPISASDASPALHFSRVMTISQQTIRLSCHLFALSNGQAVRFTAYNPLTSSCSEVSARLRAGGETKDVTVLPPRYPLSDALLTATSATDPDPVSTSKAVLPGDIDRPAEVKVAALLSIAKLLAKGAELGRHGGGAAPSKIDGLSEVQWVEGYAPRKLFFAVVVRACAVTPIEVVHLGSSSWREKIELLLGVEPGTPLDRVHLMKALLYAAPSGSPGPFNEKASNLWGRPIYGDVFWIKARAQQDMDAMAAEDVALTEHYAGKLSLLQQAWDEHVLAVKAAQKQFLAMNERLAEELEPSLARACFMTSGPLDSIAARTKALMRSADLCSASELSDPYERALHSQIDAWLPGCCIPDPTVPHVWVSWTAAVSRHVHRCTRPEASCPVPCCSEIRRRARESSLAGEDGPEPPLPISRALVEVLTERWREREWLRRRNQVELLDADKEASELEAASSRGGWRHVLAAVELAEPELLLPVPELRELFRAIAGGASSQDAEDCKELSLSFDQMQLMLGVDGRDANGGMVADTEGINLKSGLDTFGQELAQWALSRMLMQKTGSSEELGFDNAHCSRGALLNGLRLVLTVHQMPDSSMQVQAYSPEISATLSLDLSASALAQMCERHRLDMALPDKRRDLALHLVRHARSLLQVTRKAGVRVLEEAGTSDDESTQAGSGEEESSAQAPEDPGFATRLAADRRLREECKVIQLEPTRRLAANSREVDRAQLIGASLKEWAMVAQEDRASHDLQPYLTCDASVLTEALECFDYLDKDKTGRLGPAELAALRANVAEALTPPPPPTPRSTDTRQASEAKKDQQGTGGKASTRWASADLGKVSFMPE